MKTDLCERFVEARERARMRRPLRAEAGARRAAAGRRALVAPERLELEAAAGRVAAAALQRGGELEQLRRGAARARRALDRARHGAPLVRRELVRVLRERDEATPAREADVRVRALRRVEAEGVKLRHRAMPVDLATRPLGAPRRDRLGAARPQRQRRLGLGEELAEARAARARREREGGVRQLGEEGAARRKVGEARIGAVRRCAVRFGDVQAERVRQPRGLEAATQE